MHKRTPSDLMLALTLGILGWTLILGCILAFRPQ